MPKVIANVGKRTTSAAGAAIVAGVVYLVALMVMNPIPTGDEPHFLIYAHSLFFNHDVNLAGSYVPTTIARYYPSSTLAAHAFDYRGNGQLHSTHYLALPVLLLPSMWFDSPVLVARLEMLLVSVVLAWQMFALLSDLGWGNQRLRLLAWAAIALSLPFVSFSNQIYPDVPAAALVVIAVRVLIRTHPSRKMTFLAAIAAAMLPWFNARFIAFSVGITAAILYRSYQDYAEKGKDRQAGRTRTWLRVAGLGLSVAPVAVSALLMAAFFEVYYGSPVPSVMYRPVLGSSPLWSVDSFYRNGLASIFSPMDGWIPFAPVHWIGLAGVIPLFVNTRSVVMRLMVVSGLLYFGLISGGLGQGYSYPGRYALVLMPLAGVALLYVIVRSRVMLALSVVTGCVSVAYVVAGIVNRDELYPDGSGRTKVPIARAAEGFWPEFEGNGSTIKRAAAEMPRETGRPDGGLGIVASGGVDKAGMLVFGPYTLLPRGSYVAEFDLAGSSVDATTEISRADVFIGTQFGPPSGVLASRTIRAVDLPSDGNYAVVALPFVTPGDRPIETRLYFTGSGEVRLRGVSTVPVSVEHGDPASWPLVVLWIAGTCLVGMLLIPLTRDMRDARESGEAS